MNLYNPQFVAALKEKDLLTDKKINELLKQNHKDTYQLLLGVISKGILPREEAERLFGDGLGVAWLDLNTILFRPEVVSRLPIDFSLKNSIILIFQLGEAITAAMVDPSNQRVIKEAERLTGTKISPSFAMKDDIQDAIEIHYKSINEIEELIKKVRVAPVISQDEEISLVELKKMAGDEAIIELSHSLTLLSLKEGASDIHIEPTEYYLRIRFRVDGVMHETMKLSNDLTEPLLSRIKLMAGMNITERRRPQDGRINLKLSKKSVDFRVSTMPTVFGEKLVMRVLGDVEVKHVPDLEELYFSKSIYKQVKSLIKTPNGVFFITGPTGCGKSTTLFSALKFINTLEVNIMTVEDPVEYRLPGINQVQVNQEIGLSFSVVLRAALRQDPDVILIGEIRDLETAKIATEAALTGHLVLSTMHTNNAIQAITRLVEIGVEPFIVGPSIIGVLSQRLVRKICTNCKESYQLTPNEIESLFVWNGKQKVTFYRGKGCENCKGTGYKGRLAIHEMVMVDDKIRELVSRNATNIEVQMAAKEIGYKSMRYDGIKKVLRGITTIEEVERITFAA